MEGKRSKGSSPAPSAPLCSELFGRKDLGSSGKSSTTTGLFNSVFAPTPSVAGRESHRSDILGPYRKQDSAGQTWSSRNSKADGSSQGSPGKGQNFLNKDKNSAYQGENIDPCFLSSSLYYGGQDICNHPSNYRNSGSSYNNAYKKDGEDNSGSSPIDSRGDWWQGSLYY